MKLLSKKQLLELVPYSDSHLSRLEKQGLFPKRIKDTRFAEKAPSYAKAFWVEHEVLDWIQARMDER